MLPSWCPNLNSTPETTKFGDIYAAGWLAKDHGKEDQSLLNAESPSRCGGHQKFDPEAKSHVQVSRLTDTRMIWGAIVGPVCRISEACQWDLNFDPENLLNAQPYIKELLAWLDKAEEICSDTLKDEDLAYQVFQKILLGAQ